MTPLVTCTADGWHTTVPELVESHLYRAGIATPTWPTRGEAVALLTTEGERIVVTDDGMLACSLGLLNAVLVVLLPMREEAHALT